jgi:hypothetical protein
MDATNAKRLRNFGLALGLLCVIFGTRLFFKHQNSNFLFLAGFGVSFAMLGFFAPFIVRPVYFVFNKTASFIFGWLITRGVLILAFYLVVVPIGLFMRFTGKDLLNLKIDKKGGSYWLKRERKSADLKQYEKQF